jgi:hexosaminidase
LVTLIDRDFESPETVYKNKNIDISGGAAEINSGYGKKNLEYPWTLKMTITASENTGSPEVLMTSDLATVYSFLEHTYKKKNERTTKKGIAIVRANMDKGETPLTSHKPDVLVFDYTIPKNKKVNITIKGDKKKTSLYVNGKLIGSYNIQTVCPLTYFGSQKERSFSGTINKVEILNYIKKK